MINRPKLNQIRHLRRGVTEKLSRMLYEHGPGNGTFLGLPFNQLVEHGPGLNGSGEEQLNQAQ